MSKDWNFEIQSHIRVFRRWDANISGDNPCSDLRILDGLASQLTDLTINSLTIDLVSPRHSDCESQLNQSQVYHELLKKLSLRYLRISWGGPKECPAIKFAINLLKNNLADLHTLRLSLDRIPRTVCDCWLLVWSRMDTETVSAEGSSSRRYTLMEGCVRQDFKCSTKSERINSR